MAKLKRIAGKLCRVAGKLARCCAELLGCTDLSYPIDESQPNVHVEPVGACTYCDSGSLTASVDPIGVTIFGPGHVLTQWQTNYGSPVCTHDGHNFTQVTVSLECEQVDDVSTWSLVVRFSASAEVLITSTTGTGYVVLTSDNFTIDTNAAGQLVGVATVPLYELSSGGSVCTVRVTFGP